MFDSDCVLNEIPGNSFAWLPTRATRACPHQKLALFSMESEAHYPQLRLEDAREEYDIVGTTRRDSDVPLLYGSWAEYNFMQPAAPKTARAMVIAAISNCNSANNRLDILQKLIEYGVSIDSIGKCVHNVDFAPDKISDRQKAKFELLRPYKFTFAFENSNVRDYVTEKYWTALVAGSVPLYFEEYL